MPISRSFQVCGKGLFCESNVVFFSEFAFLFPAQREMVFNCENTLWGCQGEDGCTPTSTSPPLKDKSGLFPQLSCSNRYAHLKARAAFCHLLTAPHQTRLGLWVPPRHGCRCPCQQQLCSRAAAWPGPGWELLVWALPGSPPASVLSATDLSVKSRHPSSFGDLVMCVQPHRNTVPLKSGWKKKRLGSIRAMHSWSPLEREFQYNSVWL